MPADPHPQTSQRSSWCTAPSPTPRAGTASLSCCSRRATPWSRPRILSAASATDSAYIASVLDQIDGPVLLVGHSYGGAVNSNAATDASNVDRPGLRRSLRAR